MRKILAFILSVFIIFAPVYAYALNPVAGAALKIVSSAGRVLMGNGDVKKITIDAISQRAMSCLASFGDPSTCSGVNNALDNAAQAEGYTVERTIVNNNVNIDIYKFALQGQCTMSYSFNWESRSGGMDADRYRSWSVDQYNGRSEGINGGGSWRYYQKSDSATPFDAAMAAQDAIHRTNPFPVTNDWTTFTSLGWTVYKKYVPEPNEPEQSQGKFAYGFYKCLGGNPLDKIYMPTSQTNNIVNNYINNMSADDNRQFVEDISNYDYSQHGDITINGGSTVSNGYTTVNNGDTVNNNYNGLPNDFSVSDDLGEKIRNDDISLDDINDDNCTKNDTGAYDQCSGDEEPPPPNDFECPVGSVKVGNGCEHINDNQCPADYIYNPVVQVCELVPVDEEQPQICSSNELTQKFCDWIGWTKEKPTPEVPTQVQIQTPEVVAINEGLINLSGSCPANTSFSFSFMGKSYSFQLDNAPACQIATMISPFIMIAGTVSAIYTYSGSSRGQSEDD